jgi:hypothetical protein
MAAPGAMPTSAVPAPSAGTVATPSTAPQNSVLPAPGGLAATPDVDSAIVMLNRIQALSGGALQDAPTNKLANPGADGKADNRGTVKVDRATLDEIRALAGEISAMLPARKQP